MCNIVKSIDSFECKEWFLYKHYAHKMPNIVYSFGLFINDKLSGVCSFGQPPPNFNNSEDICIGIENVRVLELSRLVVNDGLPKNTLSNFVSKCLKLLPKPMIIVSYSDTRQGHNGYIYQATNWITQVYHRKQVVGNTLLMVGGLAIKVYFINTEQEK